MAALWQNGDEGRRKKKREGRGGERQEGGDDSDAQLEQGRRLAKAGRDFDSHIKDFLQLVTLQY